MQLSTAIKLFIDRYQSPATRDSYKWPLRHFENYMGSTRPLADITPIDVERWNIQLINEPGRNNTTINKYRQSVKTLLNYYVKLEVLESNPAKILRINRRVKPVPRTKAMPDDLLMTLITYTSFKKRKRDVALVCFLADTGARIGEAENLLTAKIDFKNRKAWVSGKTGGRYVPLFDQSVKWLKEWLAQQGGQSPYTFSTTDKKQTQLDQEFRRACKAAGIGSWGPHSLRHRKGFQHSDIGNPPQLAQQQFGHSDVKMTLDHYYPHDWDRVVDAAAKLALPSDSDDNSDILKPDFREA